MQTRPCALRRYATLRNELILAMPFFISAVIFHGNSMYASLLMQADACNLPELPSNRFQFIIDKVHIFSGPMLCIVDPELTSLKKIYGHASRSFMLTRAPWMPCIVQSTDAKTLQKWCTKCRDCCVLAAFTSSYRTCAASIAAILHVES